MQITKDQIIGYARSLVTRLDKLTAKQRKAPVESHAALVAQLNKIIDWARQLAPGVAWPQQFQIQEDAGFGIPMIAASLAAVEFAAQETLSLISDLKSVDEPAVAVPAAAQPAAAADPAAEPVPQP